jgi:hypothetical protein
LEKNNMSLQNCINETVHQGAVYEVIKDRDLGIIEVHFFPNLEHAFVCNKDDEFWTEASGPKDALELYLQKYYWET